eukprot:2904095-Rhodomonas_salina.1
MNWYAICVEGVALLTRGITHDIGAPTCNSEWDKSKPLSANALSELLFWSKHLPSMALQAKPIWLLTAEQATARFHARLPG